MGVAIVESGGTTLRNRLRLLLRGIWKILKFVLILLLIGMLLGAGALAVWARAPVQTGAGELTRLEAARVYLYLMGEQEPWPCYWTYVLLPIMGAITVSGSTTTAALRGDIPWSELPEEVLSGMEVGLVGVLHTHAGICRIAAPADWTPDLVGEVLQS